MCNFSYISCKRLLYLYINNRILLGLKSKIRTSNDCTQKLLVSKKRENKKRIK